MKRFLLKVTLFLIPLFLVFAAIFMIENGFSDSFYLRFTTPKQHSMIIGTSRAAQGLMPAVINEKLKGHSSYPIYNFSFTVYHSPFGKAYFNGIKNKLQDGDQGIFIVAVDPWSISADTEDPNDENTFPERTNFLATVNNVDVNPNLEYLLKYYGEPYYNILLRRVKPTHLRLHDDGWLEATVKMDSLSVTKRTREKIEQYRKTSQVKSRFSATRLEYLKQIIALLKQHGSVYLVRLPTHPDMVGIEEQMMPDFNKKIETLTDLYHVPYLDMTPQSAKYRYTDGNHLHKTSSKEVSAEVSNWITSFSIAKKN